MSVKMYKQPDDRLNVLKKSNMNTVTGDLSRVYPASRLMTAGIQPPRDPTDGLSGYRKWMDG